jgi:hypothetical protein
MWGYPVLVILTCWIYIGHGEEPMLFQGYSKESKISRQHNRLTFNSCRFNSCRKGEINGKGSQWTLLKTKN